MKDTPKARIGELAKQKDRPTHTVADDLARQRIAAGRASRE